MAKRKQPPPNPEAYALIWTEEASQSLWNVWEWIAEQSQEKADILYDEIRTKIELLAKHPLLGLPLPEFTQNNTRQLIISKHYRVIYRVEQSSQRIFILTIHPIRIPLSLWSDLS